MDIRGFSPGIKKTSLVRAIAEQMGEEIKEITMPAAINHCSTVYVEVDEEELADTLLLEDLKLKVYIGENDTFAFVTMFEDKQLREAAMTMWEDGCWDFSARRGLYEVELDIESGFEEEGIALHFKKFTKIKE